MTPAIFRALRIAVFTVAAFLALQFHPAFVEGAFAADGYTRSKKNKDQTCKKDQLCCCNKKQQCIGDEECCKSKECGQERRAKKRSKKAKNAKKST